MEDCNRRFVNMDAPKRFFDLNEVRSLPIKDVCSSFGIPVERSNFIKLRPGERTASTKLYISKGSGYDTFKDFGSGAHGDCINLIENWLGCSWQEALEAVADAFGIQPVNNYDFEQRGVLSNHQWSKIGIYGDVVAKNLDFDLERFSPESAMKYAAKYQMPVNKLREDDPGFYISAILRNKAFPFVYGLRNGYFMMIYQEQSMQKAVAGSVKFGWLSTDTINNIEAVQNRLVTAEKLLRLALRGTDIKFKSREYNLEKDWEEMLEGKISFEIGPNSNAEIKSCARQNNLNLLYTKIPVDDYYAYSPMDSSSAPFAAFLKGDTVNLVYTSRDEKIISELFHLSPLVVDKTTDDIKPDVSMKSVDAKEHEAPANVSRDWER